MVTVPPRKVSYAGEGSQAAGDGSQGHAPPNHDALEVVLLQLTLVHIPHDVLELEGVEVGGTVAEEEGGAAEGEGESDHVEQRLVGAALGD